MKKLIGLTMVAVLSLVSDFGRGAAPSAGAPVKDDPVGAKVVGFARGHKGEQVGDGECATLAAEALKAAGAQRRGADKPEKGDYTWGKLVFTIEAGGKTEGKVADVQPGAVVQFRNAKFKWREDRGTWTETMPHHTAIVAGVEDNGRTIRILHQNHNGDRTVQDGTIRLNALQEGWLRFYQPLPK